MDEAIEAGVVLLNVSGSFDKRHIVESTGSGACFLDFDLDGRMDLYLVNGATLETLGPTNPSRNALYRNEGDGKFTDVTAHAGVGDNGWGGGCAAADYDNDGDTDLYVTNYGGNVLYRNNGDGIFTDTTAVAGVGDTRWSSGAAFVDIDNDGDLDLYVANYLIFNPAERDIHATGCYWKGTPVMCGPRGFEGEPDVLYRNDGDGSFTDISDDAGVAGVALFGLGVVAGDVDGDGDSDLFVANDSQFNFLYRNDAHGRFEEQGLMAGVALSGDGRQQAGMGIDLGDYDGDGDEDLFVTNFSDDYHILYRNDGDCLFTDVSSQAGLTVQTRPSLGWGGGFFDFDNDGDLDLFVAGGHVYPQVDECDSATSFRQRNLLFRNDGNGRFTDVAGESGSGLALERGSRGVAFGDYDDDGDLDVLVVNENDVPSLLRNDFGNERHWVKVRLIGGRSNRDGIGTRIHLYAGGRMQFREVRVNTGYYSSHDPRIHFGLDGETRVQRLELRWPSGTEQTFLELPADHLITIDEERGIAAITVLGSKSRAPMAMSADAAPSSGPAATGPSSRPAATTAGRSRLSAEDLHEVDSLVQAGTRHIMAGRYERGIAAYENALALLPSWDEASKSPDALGFGDPRRYQGFLAALYDNLGVGLMRAERLDECAPAIERAIAILPDQAKFHHNLGLCHFHARRYDDAVSALKVARSASDPRSAVHYDLGRALARAGRCQEAAVELSLAIKELPRPDLKGRRAESWYYLGGCHADEGKPDEAARAFREVLAIVPGHQKALYKLAVAFRRMGEHAMSDRTLELFRARQGDDETARSLKRSGPRSPTERLRLARAYLGAGLAPQALREIQTVLASKPDDRVTLLLLGEVALALRPPDLNIAASAFHRVMRTNPIDSDALSGLGQTYYLRGRKDEAGKLFAKALAIQPGHVGASVASARLAALSGETDKAVEELERILQQAPDNADALRALARIYVSSAVAPDSKPAESLRILDSLCDLRGESVEIRVRALALLGKHKQAQALLRESPFLGESQRVALQKAVGTN